MDQDRKAERILEARAVLCGQGLRAIREKRGLSLREAVCGTTLDHAHLSRVECGERGASVLTLGYIARIYRYKSTEALLDVAESLQRKRL